jgi:DNA-binding IclR family transcriptional regulator
VAKEKMENLQNKTGETIVLDIKEGIEAIQLFKLTGTHSISYNRTHVRFPLWAGGIGRVLLSQLSDEEIDIILDNSIFVSYTEKTIVNKKQLKNEIDKVRQTEYTASIGEVESDVGAVCAPVKGYLVPAVISLVGPQERIAARLDDLVDEIKITARKISADILDFENP